MAKRKRKELFEAERFHAAVVSLMRVSHADWTEWEEEWLQDEARRPPGYIYTEAEWRILNQLIAYSHTFTHYAGHTIQQLIEIAHPYRADFSEDQEEFLEELQRWRATDLKLR
jgi:hypothetical protein